MPLKYWILLLTAAVQYLFTPCLGLPHASVLICNSLQMVFPISVLLQPEHIINLVSSEAAVSDTTTPIVSDRCKINFPEGSLAQLILKFIFSLHALRLDHVALNPLLPLHKLLL